MEDKVIVMTTSQLSEFAANVVAKMSQGNQQPKGNQQPQQAKRYVYGLRGIRDLFNVSHVTAQRYKNTFLAPAIKQQGRKIMVDADMAMELYGKRGA